MDRSATKHPVLLALTFAIALGSAAPAFATKGIETLALAADGAVVANPNETHVLLDSTALEELVGRVALYPDELLAIVLPASTYPLQIVQAARYLEAHESDPALEPSAEWDDSIIALLNYPEVIELLNTDLDWTWQLGEAVINQQADVVVAVEHFRERAHAAPATSKVMSTRSLIQTTARLKSPQPTPTPSMYLITSPQKSFIRKPLPPTITIQDATRCTTTPTRPAIRFIPARFGELQRHLRLVGSLTTCTSIPMVTAAIRITDTVTIALTSAVMAYTRRVATLIHHIATATITTVTIGTQPIVSAIARVILGIRVVVIALLGPSAHLMA